MCKECPEQVNSYQLEIAKGAEFKIIAACLFSSERLLVNAGQVYEITCEKHQRWKDSFVSSSPKGFFNPLALLAGLRLKGTRCFCLCGAYDESENGLFEIGEYREVTVPEGKKIMSFFANDSIRHYKNNSGAVWIRVRRLR